MLTPISNARIDLKNQDLKHDVARLLQSTLGTTSELKEMIMLTGGTTNTIYQCEMNDSTHVILRIFGDGTQVFIDRAQEESCFKVIAKRGLGPRLLACFSNGRIEEYVFARPLMATQLRHPSISMMIARKVRDLHMIQDVPERLGPAIPMLFHRLRCWTKLALEKCGSQYHGWDIEALSNKEVDRLEKRLSQTPSPTVLCHNDLNHLNLLLKVDHVTKEPSAIVLIDLEYAGWNPRGFDLGNHFCEWASDFQSPLPHRLDFDQFYPSHEQQKAFVMAYLSNTHDTASPPITPSNDEMESIIKEANEYALASHLFWGSWALIQSCLSNLEFNFLDYAHQRLKLYYKGMEEPVSTKDEGTASSNKLMATQAR